MADQTITQSVTTNLGTVIGVLHQGATADEVVAALRNANMLNWLTARVPEASFHQLLDIVGRVPQSEAEGLVRIYHATLPPTAHVRNNPIPSLLLADLCDQPILKAWPPLIEFVERVRLATDIEPAIAAELGQWVDANAWQVTPAVPAYEIERLRKTLEREAQQRQMGVEGHSWLQVYLEPDWLNRTQERKQPLFRVELVLNSANTNGPLPLEFNQGDATAKQLWTLEELPALLDRTFADPETVAKIPDLPQLVIEVVAPSDTLIFGFERWRRNNSASTYAMSYPLVVRLRDRLTIPNEADQRWAEHYWRKQWHAFQGELCQHSSAEIEWRTPEALDVIDLQDDPDAACLGLASPLLPDKREVFDALRDAGIPIAIWLRGPDLASAPQPDVPAQIAALLEGRPLRELYKQVQRVRRMRAVRDDAQHIGNALTLLWDDPDRPPLKYQEQGVYV